MIDAIFSKWNGKCAKFSTMNPNNLSRPRPKLGLVDGKTIFVGYMCFIAKMLFITKRYMSTLQVLLAFESYMLRAKINVLKIGSDRPVRSVEPRTGHSIGPILCHCWLWQKIGQNPVELWKSSNRIEPAVFRFSTFPFFFLSFAKCSY